MNASVTCFCIEFIDTVIIKIAHTGTCSTQVIMIIIVVTRIILHLQIHLKPGSH